MTGFRGFVLQPTYRIQRIDGVPRPIVHLHGILEDGRSFLVRDGRRTPSFWIRSRDAARAAKLGAERIEPTDRRTLDYGQPGGHAASRIDLRIPPDAPPLRDRLHQHGVRTYEADVRFARRFLIDHGVRGSLEIRGEPVERPPRGIDVAWDDPEVRPADFNPTLQVLSLDIETDPRAERLFSVALFGAGAAEVLLWCPDGLECPANATGFETEKELLRATAERIRRIDPDVLTGWNVVDFDFRVLQRLAEAHGVPLHLGRGRGELRLRSSNSPWNQYDASVPGRVVLDGIQLLRSSFVKMESYGLGAVAKEVLGETKLIEGNDRGRQIEDAFRHDRQLLVEYNLRDARLVLDILHELQLVELAVERSRLTGLPIDRVGGSIAALDFLYLEELGRRDLVAPSVRTSDEASSPNLGGHVFEPETGLWDNVLVFDFKSLYPSIMRTFQVDPLGFVGNPDALSDADADADAEDLIRAPNGAAFRRAPGILPALLDDLFPRREEAKQAGDEVKSHAIKILMNSFYGVLGADACRFSHPAIAGAITAWGRELLRWSKQELERRGHRVLYGDTDSLFVLSGEEDAEDALALGERLAQEMNRAVDEHVREKWDVDSKLELELEKLYRQLLLPAMRGGGGGARKRYVGLVGEGDDAEVVFTGMEVVRRDWTEMAKRVQRELYGRLFLPERHAEEGDAETALREYLERIVEEIRAGEHDEHLVYVKALRKSLDEYTATTPPHVAAAKKLSGKPGRMIRYVITVAGPEPAKELKSDVDHEHYVQKQIRPVAEPVLEVLGLDFDEVIGDEVQLELF